MHSTCPSAVHKQAVGSTTTHTTTPLCARSRRVRARMQVTLKHDLQQQQEYVPDQQHASEQLQQGGEREGRGLLYCSFVQPHTDALVSQQTQQDSHAATLGARMVLERLYSSGSGRQQGESEQQGSPLLLLPQVWEAQETSIEQQQQQQQSQNSTPSEQGYRTGGGGGPNGEGECCVFASLALPLSLASHTPTPTHSPTTPHRPFSRLLRQPGRLHPHVEGRHPGPVQPRPEL